MPGYPGFFIVKMEGKEDKEEIKYVYLSKLEAKDAVKREVKNAMEEVKYSYFQNKIKKEVEFIINQKLKEINKAITDLTIKLDDISKIVSNEKKGKTVIKNTERINVPFNALAKTQEYKEVKEDLEELSKEAQEVREIMEDYTGEEDEPEQEESKEEGKSRYERILEEKDKEEEIIKNIMKMKEPEQYA
jgi:hypothetical protein